MTRAALMSAALVLLTCSGLTGCDAAPGLPDEVRRPSVTAFTLSPDTDSLATDAATALVPLVLDATLAGEGPIRVRALVRYGEAPRGVSSLDTLVAQVDTLISDPGAVRIGIPLVLPRGATGEYAVTLTTEGTDGRAGDGAAGVFRFRAASLGPPVIASIEADAVVTRPAGGRAVPFPITATVTDPDGRANISAVFLADGNGGLIGSLYDEGRDGRGRADQTAADGQYTAAIQIVAANQPGALEPGTYELFVVAFDRAGMQSEAVPFTFEVR